MHGTSKKPFSPPEFAGAWTHDTATKNAGAHFIDYMPPKRAGTSAPKPSASPLKFSGEAPSSDNAPWWTQGAAALDMVKVALGSRRGQRASRAEDPAGLATGTLASMGHGGGLNGKLSSPQPPSPQQPSPPLPPNAESGGFARAAAAGMQAASLLQPAAGLSADEYKAWGPPARLEEESSQLPRDKRRLRPEVTGLLYPEKPLSARRAQGGVVSISELVPESFDGSAGLTSKEIVARGPKRFSMMLHEAIKPTLHAAQRAGAESGRGGELPEAGVNRETVRVEMRHGAEAAALLAGDVADPPVTIYSDAPAELFDGAAGVASMQVHDVNRLPSHYGGGPKTGDHHLTAKDEIRHSLYGGGPRLVGTSEDLSELRADARLSSVGPDDINFDGAAGASSKLNFLQTSLAAAECHYFSENLRFRPVGVPGIGTDARPMPSRGAAGVSTEQQFLQRAERMGLSLDPRLPPNSPSSASAAGATAAQIYSGAAPRDKDIPQLNPTAFQDAAGISSVQMAASEAVTTQGWTSLAAAEEAALTAAADAESPATGATTAATLTAASPKPHGSRRGAELPASPEAFSIFGSTDRPRRPSSRCAWEDMPASYDGAAGLSSQEKNYVVTRGDPVFSAFPRKSGLVPPNPTADELVVTGAQLADVPPSPSALTRREAERISGGQGVAAALAASATQGAAPAEWERLPTTFSGAAGSVSTGRFYSLGRDQILKCDLLGTDPAPPREAAGEVDADAAGLTSVEWGITRRPIGLRYARGPGPGAEAPEVMYPGSPEEAERQSPTQQADARSREIAMLAPTLFRGAAGLTSLEVTHAHDIDLKPPPNDEAEHEPPPYDVVLPHGLWPQDVARGERALETTAAASFGRPPSFNLPAAGMGGPSSGFARFSKAAPPIQPVGTDITAAGAELAGELFHRTSGAVPGTPGMGAGPMSPTPPPWWAVSASEPAQPEAPSDGWYGVRSPGAARALRTPSSPRASSPRPSSPRPLASPRDYGRDGGARDGGGRGGGAPLTPRASSPRPLSPRAPSPRGPSPERPRLGGSSVADCFDMSRLADAPSKDRARVSPKRERPPSPGYGWWYDQPAQRPPSPRGTPRGDAGDETPRSARGPLTVSPLFERGTFEHRVHPDAPR